MVDQDKLTELSQLLIQLGFDTRSSRINFLKNTTLKRSNRITDYTLDDIDKAIDTAQLFINNRNAEWSKWTIN